MSFARVRALVVVGLLAVIALVFVVVAVVRDTQSKAGTAENCPEGWPIADVRLREQKDVKINVYNGTDEVGLAGSVADDFRNRKFQVKKEGNAPKAVDDVAVLRFGPKGVGSAHLLRAYFLNNAKLEPDLKRKDDTVDVILGNGFQQLATTTEVNQSLGDLGSPQAPAGTCPGPVK
ncbi:LytR family transcriptional regulator [Micromonospora terminaliae]|uniref:LytR C-terminal domain-containing protein n=1 Tax=Micromonospora terminaliae TaxID=1914461 RepID=A0AAJ3DIZ4_9ACTN|nr:LytR C-terminal domain-containing protein [Micromonospora terminaliae]NES28307.1 LytR C-terminal domain-containing protein [Micromonospora terminaliae]QGL45955.1 LytR family transcriptional regulator [Micromonospora terminaliae]